MSKKNMPQIAMSKTSDYDLPAISYTVWPADLHGHRFHVKLRIQNPDPSGQVIQLPAWIPGSYLIRDFSKHIETIAGYRGDQPHEKLLLERIDNDQWRLPNVNGPVEIFTTVYAFDSSVRAAYLDSERAFFNPSNLCFLVKGQEDLPCALAIAPPEESAAHAWMVQTSLQSVKTDAQGFGFYLAANYADLIDHPVALGDFQCIQWKSHGTTHTMAIQGCLHAIDASRLANDLQAICASTIELFEPKTKKAPFNQYLFLVNAVLNGYGGLEHRNSTALLCRRDQIPQVDIPLDERSYQEFLGLCSHEYFHAWLVKRIQPKVFQPYQLDRRNYTRLLWLFEGFTSYYDDLQLFRSQRIDLKTYLNLLSENWNAILRSPGREIQSLADSSFDAWTKYYQVNENTPNAVVSYYGKGALLALGLDLSIREFTQNQKSLDDLMRALWQRHGLTQEGIAENGLEQLILDVVGLGFRNTWHQFQSRYIFGTEDIPLQKWFNPTMISVKPKSQTKVERIKLQLGIRHQEVDGWIKISAVLNGGAGQAAGLAAGDLLASINGQRVTGPRFEKVLSSLQENIPVTFTFYRDDLEHERVAVLRNSQIPLQYTLIPTPAQPN